mmetsp:Transcript_26273/g.87073  ORF Transcript_26273/g.87073 Transcript_26273/m.87073 type:complete len:612 (-) Transcript_26273:190-2025(-)
MLGNAGDPGHVGFQPVASAAVAAVPAAVPRLANRPLAALRRDIEADEASRLFHETRLLGYKERLQDGFRALFAQEVLLVDARADPALRSLLNFLHANIPVAKDAAGNDAAAGAIAFAAQTVAATLGRGSTATTGSEEARFTHRIRSLRLPPQGELPIGFLFRGEGLDGRDTGCGLQRHRAVLLKYVCDALGFGTCALVGRHSEGEGSSAGILDAAFVVANIGSPWAAGQAMLVDCSEHPGALQPAPPQLLDFIEQAAADERRRLAAEPSRYGSSSGPRLPLGFDSSPKRVGIEVPSSQLVGASPFGGAPSPSPRSPALRKLAAVLDSVLRGPDFAAAAFAACCAPVQYVSFRPVDPDRRPILEAAFPEIREAALALAVTVRSIGAVGAPSRELIAVVPAGVFESLEELRPQLVMGACRITSELLSPSECIEFTFPEGPNYWVATPLSRWALETYKATKFEAWQRLLKGGGGGGGSGGAAAGVGCEAQLRRLMELGPVLTVFDDVAFPTPQELRPAYEVSDTITGEVIKLPHPVAALRVWNASALCYEPLDARLAGAPADDEVSDWWETMVEPLKHRVREDGHTSLTSSPGRKKARPGSKKKKSQRASKSCC